MDRMPSSEFRRRYAALTTPVQVTVNGHVIGQWIPVTYEPLGGVVRLPQEVAFRPAPKPPQKRR